MHRQTLIGIALAAGVLGVTGASTGVAIAQTAAGNVNVPTGQVELGSIEMPRQVMADGQTLASGTYDLRLTGDSASPEAVGQLAVLERWVEFRQDGQVRGREVVSIVPQTEISDVAKTSPPASGSSRVEVLKDDEYLRVWVNQNDTHYIIHLVVS